MDHKKLKEEANLEAWLQKTAFGYKDLMTSKDPKEKKTLRTRLAEYYNDMVKRYGDVAKKRFPHMAYGQDPNSETFRRNRFNCSRLQSCRFKYEEMFNVFYRA